MTTQTLEASCPSAATRLRRFATAVVTALLAALVASGAGYAASPSHPAAPMPVPPRGSPGPSFALKDLNGSLVESSSFAKRPIVLLFGELKHEGVRKASTELMAVLAEGHVAATKPAAFLVIAQDAPLATLKADAEGGRFPSVILHDPKRELFAACHVVTLPTLVVIDGGGTVVHAMPGFVPRFREIVADAILVAGGKRTLEDLDRTIDPTKPGPQQANEHVTRLVGLGKQLSRHGLFEPAQARFAEALALEPGNVSAQLGLADLLLKQDRLADAEPLYRAVLNAHPDSVDAALGAAELQIRRGGDEIAKAEATLKGLMASDSKVARTHYLLGQIYEKRGELPQAIAAYRRAAELAMDGVVPPVGTVIPGG